MSAPAYPFAISVAPLAPQSRLTVFFRHFMVIPHFILLYFLQIAQQVITLIAWFAVLFTGRYPVGMYKFATDVLRWQTRVSGYQLLLTGVYPPFSLEDAEYPVVLYLTPQIEGRNRLTTFFRPFLAIPNLVVFAFVAIAAMFVLFVGWVAALLTGKLPAGIHNFLTGFLRWNTRLSAYTLLLTDQYPPFSLS